MKKYDFKCFTDIETPETDEIKELLQNQKNKYILILGIEITILLITCLFILPFFTEWYISLTVFILFSIIIIIPSIIFYRYKTSYLRIAKFNDKIRHEERIRVKERKRFEELLETNNQTNNIQKQNFTKELESIISLKKDTTQLMKNLPPKQK